MSTFLEYIRKANAFTSGSLSAPGKTVRIAMVTNFTDDILEKILIGMCVDESIHPVVYRVPFQQYQFELKNTASPLWNFNADITFVFFDVHEYQSSAFTFDEGHAEDVYADIVNYSEKSKGLVVIQSVPLPSSRQYERILKTRNIREKITTWNKNIEALAQTKANVFTMSTEKLFRRYGEEKVRDLRGMYAFSQPFQTDFLVEVAREWVGYIRVLAGQVKKCIVLDLDNTLWGGVLGEQGVSGIALGHEYPGNAFLEFQRTLLHFYEHGVILAINSRNNIGDVEEVLKNHPHMVLKEEHFALIVANWNDKATNLRKIAEELNIGLDSLVFLDDDPMNRELVMQQLPEVLVPEFSVRPEEYTRLLLNLDIFHSYDQSDEDAMRGRMYAQERKRKELSEHTPNIDAYIASLAIQLSISINDTSNIARLAQLTQKTNQYNLTTYRSTEHEIAHWIEAGSLVYGGMVTDKFGPYGITCMAVVHPQTATVATLHIFLMSCRVVGRQVEQAFLSGIIEDLYRRGYSELHGAYIPTVKNIPVKDFLITQGLTVTNRGEDGSYEGFIDLESYRTYQKGKEKLVTIHI